MRHSNPTTGSRLLLPDNARPVTLDDLATIKTFSERERQRANRRRPSAARAGVPPVMETALRKRTSPLGR